MNRVLLNTLYIMSETGYLKLDNETVRYERDDETIARIPCHHLSTMVLQENILVSPRLLQHCAKQGIAVAWLSRFGQFAGAFRPPTGGNVLLRIAQFEAYKDRSKSLAIAKSCALGKLINARHTIARKARDTKEEISRRLKEKKDELERLLKQNPQFSGHDQLRGYEGQGTRIYFSAFPDILANAGEHFQFERRTRRPPRDPLNALLSFVYTLATNDCRAALEGVGLDPQIGFLHELRPGRPSLALDLVEELRTSFADRLAFALINRKQITKDSFEERPGGAVLLNENGRKTFLEAYQKRKQEMVPRPLFEESIPFGLVPHVQARLLARHLREELETYVPFTYR